MANDAPAMGSYRLGDGHTDNSFVHAPTGYPTSPVALLDSKAMRRQMNGNTDMSFEVEGLHNSSPAITKPTLAQPTYDPALLLNPKAINGYQSRTMNTIHSPSASTTLLPATQSISPQFIFQSPNIDSLEHRRDNEEDYTMGGLIERVHNVEDRSSRPMKKQKLEHEQDVPKASFVTTGSGGVISGYVKQMQKEGQKGVDAVSTLVDLTADDNDDDVVFVSANDESEKEVCYGRLDNPKVTTHKIPNPNPKATYFSTTDWPPSKLTLHRLHGRGNTIMVRDPTDMDFGNVDVRTSLVLAPLLEGKFPGVRAQARLSTRPRNPYELPGQQVSDSLRMTVNLYGPKKYIVHVGNFLKQKQITLMSPFTVDAGIEVHNPHSDDKPTTSRLQNRTGPGSNYVIRTAEEIKNDVAGIFDSLEQSEHLEEMDADSRIKTPLLSHQRQGLFFMTNRERVVLVNDNDEDASKSLWQLRHRRNGQRMYVNVITGSEERARPLEVRGGILADMMGLGKTLSILSLIVGSLADGETFAETATAETDDGAPLKICSKTTLLVSPLSVVANWEEQIETHIQPGTLKYYIYHGGNRLQDVDELAKYDVVITTYSIVSSEVTRRSKKRTTSPLLDTKFFRIVLDEAHMIREQSTMQSQAICTLSSERRWALTGTPVQNKLDDLGALIKFLRVKPFDESRNFAQHILSPFKNADPEILPKLRVLVDSITLRRLKDRIDLPPRKDVVEILCFSKEERELYDWFAKDADNRIRTMTARRKGLGGKTMAHMLQSIRRLRLISVHGRELLSEDDLKICQGLNPANAIDLDDDDPDHGRNALSAHKAYEFLMLCKDTNADICSQCTQKIGPKDDSEDLDQVIGTMLPCFTMICNGCIAGFKKHVMSLVRDNRFVCPFCAENTYLSFFELTQGGVEDAEEVIAQKKGDPHKAKVMGRYQGPHTKVIRLLEGLNQARIDSQQLPNEEPPIKSVVFSEWTTNLDLIQLAFEDNGINFVRLDGKMSRAQRNRSLEEFRENPKIEVILVSLKAGGLGLNLTSASRVYVMEPQWNPAAEAQAVDRVHRLGQKREVTAYRLIMDSSIEEKILELQKKKESLADLSMNRKKLDKGEAMKKKLEDIRSLFRR